MLKCYFVLLTFLVLTKDSKVERKQTVAINYGGLWTQANKKSQLLTTKTVVGQFTCFNSERCFRTKNLPLLGQLALLSKDLAPCHSKSGDLDLSSGLSLISWVIYLQEKSYNLMDFRFLKNTGNMEILRLFTLSHYRKAVGQIIYM